MRSHWVGTIVCTAVALAVRAAGGTTYYVNGDCGSDAWSGTSAVCAAPDGPKATIQAGINAAVDGDEIVVADGVYTGSGNRNLDFEGRLIVLRSANGPENCIVDCEGAGFGFVFESGETAEAVVAGFTIRNGSAYRGGAIHIYGSSLTVRDCIFADNSAEIAGAIDHGDSGDLTLEYCTFVGNVAEFGAAAVFTAASNITAIGCVFSENDGGQTVGAVGSVVDAATFINCAFLGNIGPFDGGGIADSSLSTTLVNCVFSRNTATSGAGVDTGSPDATVSSCTFSHNVGWALRFTSNSAGTVMNSVFWGNPEQMNNAAQSVTFCDVEGGWPGVGNIDADPLFVQPGVDNVRLSEGSPCLDAGNNALLEPDTHDLDGDGDTDEPIPIDLDGNARVIDGIVDMGAYEGAGQAEPPASGVEDLDQGEFAVLVPDGETFDPAQHAAAFVQNTTGPDDSSFTVTQFDWNLHPEGLGFSELGVILQSETNLASGQFFLRLYLPFDAGMLGGVDPLSVQVTYFDEAVGNWALAVAANTADSPGYPHPIGDRIVTETADDNWGTTFDLGDYGVFWDPVVEQGFAWANVDHKPDAGLGAALCPADCVQTPDGLVGVADLFAVLGALAGIPGNGSCDINLDGVVDVLDVQAMLAAWGPCPEMGQRDQGILPPSPAGGAPGRMVRSADVDGSGVVDREDLLLLRDAWGPCAIDCPADLDANGEVNVADILGLLAGWGVISEGTAVISKRRERGSVSGPADRRTRPLERSRRGTRRGRWDR